VAEVVVRLEASRWSPFLIQVVRSRTLGQLTPANGNGIMFISHIGDMQPSSFLPLVAGNVRTSSPVALHREAPLFAQLRQPASLRGRCGRCSFRAIRGRSRKRAYAASGDILGEDPLCAHKPAARRKAASDGWSS
jgi:MoaA/NifB/PqqE/SkfB family radical SAM enzyme